MQKRDPHPTLTKEDQALWEKVSRTINQPKPKKSKSTGKALRSGKSDCQPTREDFALMLGESGNADFARSANDRAAQKPAKLITEPAREKRRGNPRIEGFSPREARQLSAGKQEIEGMIDLHGHTQKAAEKALKQFLRRAHQDGKRFVLVITGKGGRADKERPFELGAPEPGVLKRRVPSWLDEIPEIVVSYKTAHKKHGGLGALYVRLRKSRV